MKEKQGERRRGISSSMASPLPSFVSVVEKGLSSESGGDSFAVGPILGLS